MDGQEKLPPPSPELVLLSAFVRAHLLTLPRKRRMAYLRRVTEAFAEFEEHQALVRIRPPAEDAAVAEARRLAWAWFRHAIGAQLTLDAMKDE